MNDFRISKAPFLNVIIPAAAGIVMASFISLPLPLIWAGFGLTALIALIYRRSAIGSYFLLCGIFFYFLAISQWRSPVSELPYGEKITAIVQIRDINSTAGRWQHATADIGYYKRLSDESGWHKVNESILLSIDSSYRITPGMQTAIRGWVNPIDTTGSSYGQLMRRRGFHSRIYITPGNMLRESPHISRTPAYYATRLHDTAEKKLDKLSLSKDSRAVVAAMTIGDKKDINTELRQKYNLSGGAHLLAVSGLHVGIVFLLLNVILYLLPSFRKGHIIKNIIAIAGIWFYAIITGLAPSVVRSALMFSFAQLALASSSRRNALNIMFGAAIVMLAINPNLAADPSFLLSYTAVFSILIFFTPIYKTFETRNKFLNVLLGIIIVGLTATIGTAPLVSYWFGNLSLIGLIINPAVILSAHIIVLAGVLWLIIPEGILSGTFSFLLEYAARFQNTLIEWSASQKWALFEGHIPLWSLLACYSLILITAIYVSTFKDKPYKKLITVKQI